MPRKDPITGVPVMTQQEFWQSLAEKEGRPAFQLQEEFYNDMEAERIAEEQRVRERAFEIVLSESQQPADPPWPFTIEECLETVFASYHGSMGGQEEYVRVLVRCSDGRHRIACFEMTEDFGDRMNPPDGETNFWYEDLNALPRLIHNLRPLVGRSTHLLGQEARARGTRDNPTWTAWHDLWMEIRKTIDTATIGEDE